MALQSHARTDSAIPPRATGKCFPFPGEIIGRMLTQHAALALASLFIVLILASAVLGPSYTGLHGDWLEGSVEFQGQTYVAEVGLNEVVLTTGAGESRRLPLRDACAMAGSRDSAASKWCSLDQFGADTEAVSYTHLTLPTKA